MCARYIFVCVCSIKYKIFNLKVFYILRGTDPSLLMEEDRFQAVKERIDKGKTIYGHCRSGTPDSGP